MCAAVRILANEDFTALSGSTLFVVRGQDVSLDEVRRYFRRKGCSDPVGYVNALPENQVMDDVDVRLRQKIYRDRSSFSDSSSNQQGTPETGPTETPTASSSPVIEPQNDVVEIGNHLQDEQFLGSGVDQALSFNSSPFTQLSNSPPLDAASFNIHLSIPTSCRHSDAMLWATGTYISTYAVSVRQRSHYEPRAHYQTLHGQFSFQIQEGVACRNRNDVLAAVTAHRQAFSLIDGIVSEDHPMSVTLILSVMCELLRGGNLNLIKHIAERIIRSNNKLQRQSHPMSILFRAVLHIERLENHHLYCALRRASEDFDFLMGNIDWRSMYLKERLCDALYHSEEVEERVRTRRRLLQDQVGKYGHNARNVLFTQMNVAEDLASLHETGRALTLYKDALARAESLTDDHGFSRGRIRFAAFEGLGNLHMSQALAGNDLQWDTLVSDAGSLKQALKCFELAEAEATTWFEASSKRSQRITERKHEAQDHLDTHILFAGQDLSNWDLMSDLSR